MLRNYAPLSKYTPSRIIVILTLLACLPCNVIAENLSETDLLVAQGRRLYEEGINDSGKASNGSPADTSKATQTACVRCHRRSGMGTVEGDILIAPVTGNYLFNPDKFQVATMDPRSGKKFNQAHRAYTEESLSKTLATGINNEGRPLLALMPHYHFEKNDMAALTAYLKQLSTVWSPGVDAETIHLATVITPEVEPIRRQAFLDTLQMSIKQKNGNTSTISNKKGRRHMTTAAEMVLGTERKWDLQVWELQGEPETWGGQLDEKYKAQPVFALLSGVSNTTWAPVHNFCENNHVPCWFPSVTLPERSEDFYTLYFSRGVILEAQVVAKWLIENDKPKRVIQIIRNEPVSIEAAKEVDTLLAKAGVAVETRMVKEGKVTSSQLTGNVSAEDVVIAWLRNDDLKEIPELAVKAIYYSAELTGGQEIKNAFAKNAHWIYPYELPEKRQSNLTNFHAWQAMKKMPIIDEPLQAEVFFAVEFLTETLSEMLDNIYRDYLIERAEGMLSRSEAIKSEQQIRERQMRGITGASIRQESTSIYPHLGLGIEQHFASKGAYIVHYDKDRKLSNESEWIVP